SNIAILIPVLPATEALAYWPINWPALPLSVANSASAASTGSVGLSSAITSTPCERAFLTAAVTPAGSGVIRIALAPALTMFSSAVTSPAASDVSLPAPVINTAPFADASRSAPWRIFTKNGFASVLVIRPTITGFGDAAALFEVVSPQPAVTSAITTPTDSTDARLRVPILPTSRLLPVFPLRDDNVVKVAYPSGERKIEFVSSPQTKGEGNGVLTLTASRDAHRAQPRATMREVAALAG